MDYRDYKLGVPRDFFWFRAKRRLVDILLGRLKTGGRARILNVGSGVGEDLSVIGRFGEVYVIDTEAEALALIPDGMVREKKLCDARAITYPDGFFDVVVAFDTLEHIEEDSKAVREITRLLKDGGAFVFTVPAFSFLFSAHDRQLSHHRRYSRASLRALLKGLRFEAMGFWTFFLFFPLAMHRLFDKGRASSSLNYFKLSGIANNFFYRLMQVENFLIRHGVPLPVGTTIFGICRKDDRASQRE
jgi:SAM-dependent methyltransferase